MASRFKWCWIAVALIAGCASDVDVSETESALSSRISPDGYIENNLARGAVATSSGSAVGHPASLINDGRRGAPYDASSRAYAYWQSSSHATVYNCNYGNWWVRLDFPPPATSFSPFGSATISELDLFSLQDNYSAGTDPTTSTATHSYGNVDFHISYCPAGTPCGSTLGSGWVDPPGGYITANTLAWTKVSFAPIAVSAIRVSFDCTQSQYAYAVELEAWSRQAPINNCSTLMTIPQDNQLAYVGDDNTNASIIADADRWWWRQIKCPICSPPSDMEAFLRSDGSASVRWAWAGEAWALIQMYDLMAPIDPQRAMVYLDQVRQISDAFLRSRDDKRLAAGDKFPTVPSGPQPPFDTLHGQVMPSWGEVTNKRWQNTALMAHLFTYPMAAFARRVADHPERFCLDFRQTAVKYTTAVLETYTAFRSDMHFVDTDPEAYWRDPYNDFPTQPMPMNQLMTVISSMSEVASAADSELYKSAATTFPWTVQSMILTATRESPRMIAKTLRFFRDHNVVGTLDGGATTYRWWPYMTANDPDHPEDTSHANTTVAGLTEAWDNRAILDGILARNGYSERVSASLDATFMTDIAHTFTRRMWFDDNVNVHNVLTGTMDGPNAHAPFYPPTYFGIDRDTGLPGDGWRATPEHNEPYCAGFAAFARFDHWVWTRCRDVVFNPVFSSTPGEWRPLGVDVQAALLRYRAYR